MAASEVGLLDAVSYWLEHDAEALAACINNVITFWKRLQPGMQVC
jgi:hypothetical protein